MINVLFIEDDEIVRQGVRLILAGVHGISVIGEASTGKEGLALARSKKPDVLLLDFKLPDTNGFALARKLLRYLPDTKLLVLTGMKGNLLPARLLKMGVSGYLTKESSAGELEQAIRQVNSGQRYLSPDIANQLALNKVVGSGAAPFDQLSEREMEVLLLLAEGLNPEVIAKQLCITSKTV